jgi:hypothetical protein
LVQAVVVLVDNQTLLLMELQLQLQMAVLVAEVPAKIKELLLAEVLAVMEHQMLQVL